MKTLTPDLVTDLMNKDAGDPEAGETFAVPVAHQRNGMAVQTTLTGTVTALSLSIQVSLDGTNWATIATSTATAGEYIHLGIRVCKFIRAYHTSNTGATNVKVSILIN